MQNLRILITFLLFTAHCFSHNLKGSNNGIVKKPEKELLSDLDKANYLFEEHNYREAIATYQKVLNDPTISTAPVLKKIAQSYSALDDVDQSVAFLEQYLFTNFNADVFSDSWFDNIRETSQFSQISEKYEPKFSIWSFMYLYVALIGFYTAILLHFNAKVEKIARILISSFIFIHSFFILHICLNITNYQYQFPHSYLMSTCFSFLYGPFLYFYFKRITENYQFKKTDLLHLVPTILFLIYAVPIYSISAEDKLKLMLDRTKEGLNPGDSADLIILVILKLTSLIIYGIFIRKLYIRSKSKNENCTLANRIWKRNVYIIHIAYVICYAGYGILISNNIMSGFLYHSQVICMALMVMYIGYCANVQPSVFNGDFKLNKLLFKYEKSGLTTSLSNELKENLMALFDNERIYKENDINLEKLANKLNTTRHNASQVINEHFNMNFHELVNTYRINEAKQIFDKDQQRILNIIDVAYEVGYNNKVTFNKAFKKDTQLTPSEYQKLYIESQV